jgi:hypothetical protein
MNKGFIQIRRGLDEHLLAGRISLFEAGVYLVIHLQANFETGMWVGSAPRLLAAAPRGAALRDIQRAIEHLSEIGFLRTFHTHGQRGNYPVLIHKYEPQFGALRGKRLNAVASTSWQHPRYESCADVDADVDAESVAEDAPIPKEERKEQREKLKKTPAAKPAPLPDPRHQPFFDFAYQLAQNKYLASPTWGGRQAKRLQSFLREHPSVELEEMKRRYAFFLQSTDSYYRQQHGSLEFFVTNFDKFLSGPIPERKSYENGNRAEQRTDRNLRAAGIV